MPVLRVHFTPDDLARTRLAPNADVQWETALSLNLLQSTEKAGTLSSWRSWAGRRLGAWVTPLLAAAPPAERFPDFVDLLRRDNCTELTSILDRYQASVITPVWPGVSTAIATDRARRARYLVEDGLEGLLATMAPTLRWQAPVLETDYPLERDVQLAGRGLVLVPSYFCSRPIVLPDPADPAGPAVLIHPIASQVRILITAGRSRGRRSGGLDALIGSTRAAVLQALADGCTTTELARRVGVSAATASQHATILREAGLISTQRHGPSVLHIVTALGSAVLKPT